MKQKHIIISSDSFDGLLDEQRRYLASADGYEPVFKRYFLSDSADSGMLPDEEGAVCRIVQPPLDGSRVAVWLWLAKDVRIIRKAGLTIACDGETRHVWVAGIQASGDGSELQTALIFKEYENLLSGMGISLQDNCIRTWIHVADIDDNYAGVVKARRENFTCIGLTPQTHYIASTGIQGKPCRDGSLVQMDAYAVSGTFTQSYLYAPTHLNPTYEYGVTFERGVKLCLPDTAQTIISGTASIDNRGAVVHEGDVRLQTLRMWENVQALLQEAGNGWDDVRQILVYLRRPEDYTIVAPMFREKFPDTPYVILLAPVCRPGWLIEMECIASSDKD